MGWSNQIPNPFIVGGGGVSGRIEVYRADNTLLASIDQDGIFFYDTSGSAIAAIGDDGEATFQDLNVIASPTFQGRDFVDDWLQDLPQGIIAWGQTSALSGSTSTELALFEVSAPIRANRTYRLRASCHLFTSVANAFAAINMRYTTNGSTPTTSSTLLALQGGPSPVANTGTDTRFDLIVPTFTTESTYRFLVTMSRPAGTGTVNVFTNAAQLAWISVEDMGRAVANTYAAAGGGGGGLTYETTYNATWSGSYNGSGTKSTFGGADRVYQGNIGDGNGNRTGLIGFDYAQIVSDLTGATINSCTLTMYAQHWYYNAGGTAIIGTHNQAVSSAPATFGSNSTNLVSSASWPKPGQRTVDLGTTIGNAFKNGTAKGICTGPGQGGDPLTYYGYFSGFGAVNPPTLTINYTK